MLKIDEYVGYERQCIKPPHPAAATFARGRNGHGGSCSDDSGFPLRGGLALQHLAGAPWVGVSARDV